MRQNSNRNEKSYLQESKPNISHFHQFLHGRDRAMWTVPTESAPRRAT